MVSIYTKTSPDITPTIPGLFYWRIKMDEFISLADTLGFTQDREVQYYNNLGIKCKGVWKANSLIEKQDKICEKHDLYTDELHTFPTGKIQWLGCAKCRRETQERQMISLIRDDMAKRGMVWDNESKRFVEKNPPVAANDSQPEKTKFRFRG